MEQNTLPIEAENARYAPSTSLTVETEQEQETPLAPREMESEGNAVESLGAELSRLIYTTQKRADRAMWSIPAFYGLMTVLLCLANALLGEGRGAALLSSPLTYIPLGLFWIGITVFLVGSIRRPRKQLRSMARTLTESQDIQAVGALIDTFSVEDRKIHEIAREGLTALLPHLQSSDTDLLNTKQRAMLYSRLNRPLTKAVGDPRALSQTAHEREVAFHVAILQAFTQIGDRSAIPVVTRWAHKEATTDGEKRIQNAAQVCLPALIARAQQRDSTQTLLRPSQASDTGAETLMRAVQGSQETSPEQLLRPGPPSPSVPNIAEPRLASVSSQDV